MKTGTKPGEFVFLPSSTLEAPWVALQGLEDQVCAPSTTQDFVHLTSHAEIKMLPKVGHGFMVQQSWMPQFKQAFGRITSAPTVENPAVVESLEDLPLVEVPAKGAGRDILGVLLTGDGGWAVADGASRTSWRRPACPSSASTPSNTSGTGRPRKNRLQPWPGS